MICVLLHQKSNFWCRISHHHMISPYMHTCNTYMKYIHEIHTCNTDMQYRHAVQTCNTDMKCIHETHTCNTTQKWRYVAHGNPTNCIKKYWRALTYAVFTQNSDFQSDWVGIGLEYKSLTFHFKKSAFEKKSKINFETCYPM